MATQLLPYALTTVQKVKDLAGIADSSKDAIILQLINAWTDFAGSYCSRKFVTSSYVELKDAKKGSNKLFLNNRPVTLLSLIEYRAGTPSAPTWITYNADSYLSYLQAGYIRFFGKFSDYVPQAFRVTYTAGFLVNWANEGDNTTHTLPADLTGIITEICVKKLNTAKAGGIAQETTEGQSVTYDASSKDLTADQRNVLDNYKSYAYGV